MRFFLPCVPEAGSAFLLMRWHSFCLRNSELPWRQQEEEEFARQQALQEKEEADRLARQQAQEAREATRQQAQAEKEAARMQVQAEMEAREAAHQRELEFARQQELKRQQEMQVQADAESKVCPGCGGRNDLDSMFCVHCGNPLSKEPEMAQPDQKQDD